MLKLNVFDFYLLGQAVHPLTELRQDPSEGYLRYFLTPARCYLGRLLAKEDTLFFSAVQREGKALLGSIDRAFQLEVDLDGIRQGARSFETALMKAFLEESGGVFAVTQKGLYNTSGLIDHAEAALPERLRAGLPAIVLNDLRQGGRCLAFETPTGAGFHLLRGVEGLIKAYYEKLAGMPWPYIKRDWWTYTDEIKKLGAPARLTDALTQLRTNYRNPLMHPQDNLDQEEALGLFGVVLSLMTLVLQEMVP